MSLRALALALLSVSLLPAVDFGTYRGFAFGSSPQDAAKLAAALPSDVKTIHQRPALIQELEWRFRHSEVADALKPDPVLGGLLSFIDGKLYRIVITYDSYRIDGMTSNDLVEAISQTYGPAVKANEEISLPSIYSDTVKVIARWQDSAHAYDLVRTGNQRDYALVLYSKSLDALAQSAIGQAARLDLSEAPSRALADEKQRGEELRLAAEKARAKNKPNFRP